MAQQKLGRKDFQIAVKTGTDANKTKFAKECVQGEQYFATDTKKLYLAETNADSSDATLAEFTPSATGISAYDNTRSISFDGTNNYMGSLPIDRLSGATWATTTPVSQSAWVKSNSFSANDAIFGIGKYNTNGTFIINASDNSGIHQQVSGGAGKYYLWLSGTQTYLSGTFNTGVWHHIAWTWDGSNGVIYVDGSESATFTDTSNGYNTRFSIWSGGGGRWNGYADCLVDELATWDSALTSGNITTLYNEGVPGDIRSLSPLVWYRMGDGNEGGSGTDIYDMSGNSSANAKLINGPTFSTTVPPN